jgi:hypothetical protein
MRLAMAATYGAKRLYKSSSGMSAALSGGESDFGKSSTCPGPAGTTRSAADEGRRFDIQSL